MCTNLQYTVLLSSHSYLILHMMEAIRRVRVLLVRDYSEKVKVCEKCGGGRTIRDSVVLYFFLLRDAPNSPSVLIGSGERPCAGRADVNRA